MNEATREIQRTFRFDDSACFAKEASTSFASQLHTLDKTATAHLIATILSGDQFDLAALQFGYAVENEYPLAALPDTSLAELQNISPGIGPEEYRKLMSAIELGRRVAEAKQQARSPSNAITSSGAALDFCRERFLRLATDAVQEEFHIVTLTTKHRVIRTHQVSVGVLSASLVHPREVFRPAIRDSAAAIIAVHNHPSGEPKPSKEDYAVTERLERAGETIGIDLLDHIVVARNGAESIRENRNT
jgi:DNA repair protein RadC